MTVCYTTPAMTNVVFLNLILPHRRGKVKMQRAGILG